MHYQLSLFHLQEMVCEVSLDLQFSHLCEYIRLDRLKVYDLIPFLLARGLFHHQNDLIPELFEPYVEISSQTQDRKSTRLNSSHVAISYAVFCLKKKTTTSTPTSTPTD